MKQYTYKIYSSAGAFIKTWNDVLSEPSFSIEMNGGFSELVVELGRDSLNFGEDSDVKYGNQLKLYCKDTDSGETGVLVYSGYISRYEPVIRGKEERILVTFLSYWHQLARHILESAGATEITYSSQDPSNILKDLLDKFTADGGKLDYATGTVDTTSTSVSYTYNTNSYQEAIRKVLELCPDDWFLRIGADDLVYLKQKAATAEHEFKLGPDIAEYLPEKRTESIINVVYFRGGDPGAGILYKKYTRSSSISNYGKYAKKIVDERVTVTATMDTMATRILDTFDSPEIRIVLKILDNNNDSGKGYDIESIKVGQTCKILNNTQKGESKWDEIIWDVDPWDFDITNAAAILLQIQKVEYHPDFVMLEISNRQPDIAKRIEDINRNLVESITADNPTTPTT